MLEQPRIPDWIREFSDPGWTNVFQLVPTNESLYPVALRAEWQQQFNDWNSKILLLAKDGCPTRVIREIDGNGESQPWRFSQRELGDEAGWQTNDKLYPLASRIPEGKLYGSAAANMLYDQPDWSRALKGFKSSPLQEYLQSVLRWVVESMPHVKSLACLGEEAWFLTCNALGNKPAASNFKGYRDSYHQVSGMIGRKTINAFPLYHPKARVSDDSMELGWSAFAASVKGAKTK